MLLSDLRSRISDLFSRWPPDYVKLHEVCRAANSHRRSRHDSDDVAFAHQSLFEEPLFRYCRQPINLSNVLNVSRIHAPDEPQAPPRFLLGRKSDDGHQRAVARDQPCRESAVSEY